MYLINNIDTDIDHNQDFVNIIIVDITANKIMVVIVNNIVIIIINAINLNFILDVINFNSFNNLSVNNVIIVVIYFIHLYLVDYDYFIKITIRVNYITY